VRIPVPVAVTGARSAARPAKTALAAAHLRRVNPWTACALLDADVTTLAPGVFAGCDAAVVATDSLRSRFAAARLLLAARVPWVDLGTLAEHGLARVTVADPAGTRGDPEAERSCPACCWSPAQLARAGGEGSLACAGAGPDDADGAASTLTVAHRAASLAVREALALAGILRMRPSIGLEHRDDLARLRLDSYRVPRNPDCSAHHDLACGSVAELGGPPDELGLAELARRCRLEPDDELLLAATEVVELALCAGCSAPTRPYRRAGGAAPPCAACGGAPVPARAARRLRWRDVASRAGAASAAALFAEGDAFAVRGRGGTRAYRFPPAPLAWQPGRAARVEDRDRALFARLPAHYDLERIRRARLAIVGNGHAGSAVLAQLAPLPLAGLILVDRDDFAPHNAQSFAIATGEEARA
jgi:molybdopterin/thiamine biosynthesis adenylyltransferase